MRPVDRVVEELEPRTGTRRFTAFCHGERESVDVTDEDMLEMRNRPGEPAFRFTVAFSRTRAAAERDLGKPCPLHSLAPAVRNSRSKDGSEKAEPQAHGSRQRNGSAGSEREI